jgi:hypothetical protein
MRCLVTEVFLNTPTPGAQRISGIKDVKNDICARVSNAAEECESMV